MKSKISRKFSAKVQSKSPERMAMIMNKVILKNIGKVINIDILYGINTDNSCFDIEYWTKKYIDDLFEKTVIIGDSLQNGFIVMICDGNNDGVYYYDIHIILMSLTRKIMYISYQIILQNFLI